MWTWPKVIERVNGTSVGSVLLDGLPDMRVVLVDTGIVTPDSVRLYGGVTLQTDQDVARRIISDIVEDVHGD
jgi:hypothetical protein